MNLREILVLLISFFLAVTIILTFRKIINYRKNSTRKSKQSSISNDEEVKVELENFSEEDYIDDDIPPEPELSSDDLIYLHIESDQSNSIQYKDLLNYFDSNDINLADEGGWLKIYLDNSNLKITWYFLRRDGSNYELSNDDELDEIVISEDEEK